MKHTSRFALAAVAAAVLAMNAATAAELTGTLKKIQETGSITLGYRESSTASRSSRTVRLTSNAVQPPTLWFVSVKLLSP